MVLLFPPIPATATLAGTLLLNSLMAPTTTMSALNYEFGNGSVQIDNPMIFKDMTFVDPKFLGAGGGGSVWNMKSTKTTAAKKKNEDGTNSKINEVVVKISWVRSADSVRNECDILNVMERNRVTGVERCLGNMEYKYDPRRVVIAMEPFVEDTIGDTDTDNDGGDITSSVADLSPEIARKSAIQLSKTMAQMLAANVVTTDLQPLISKTTGEVVLIDMTEATVFQPDHVMTEIDKALINAFCTEMIGLIPDYLLDEASKSFLNELRRIEMDTHIQLDAEIKDVLRDLPLKGVENLSSRDQ
jgi:hypothetical protein